MPRHVNRMPEMRLHKATGQAYVRLNGKFHYLGKHGSPESRVLYERTIAEWLARDRSPVVGDAAGVTVTDLLSAFMAHAIAYYRSADGKPTGEADNFKDAVRPLFDLYADLPAAEFTTDELDAVRARMIDSGLARSTINARVNKIRRIWKWAVKTKMAPYSCFAALTTLEPLLKNKGIKESPKIEPVSFDRIKAVLPHVPSEVSAMIQLQVLTGCRVSEVLRMRVGDIKCLCDPWEYRPGRYKGDHRENSQERVIPLGPKAQSIVSGFLAKRSKMDDHLFSPRDAVAESQRKGKLRRNMKVKSHYDRRAYTQAIYRGCDRAFPHPDISKIKLSRTRKLTEEQKAELTEWRKKNRWSPLQIRHATATLIREKFGLEAAQAMLGHAKMDTTQIYAEKQRNLARKVAKKTG